MLLVRGEACRDQLDGVIGRFADEADAEDQGDQVNLAEDEDDAGGSGQDAGGDADSSAEQHRERTEEKQHDQDHSEGGADADAVGVSPGRALRGFGVEDSAHAQDARGGMGRAQRLLGFVDRAYDFLLDGEIARGALGFRDDEHRRFAAFGARHEHSFVPFDLRLRPRDLADPGGGGAEGVFRKRQRPGRGERAVAPFEERRTQGRAGRRQRRRGRPEEAEDFLDVRRRYLVQDVTEGSRRA